MFFKITLASLKFLSFFLLILIASQEVSGATTTKQGVRRRNKQKEDPIIIEEIKLNGKNSCDGVKCAAVCVEDSCSLDMICVEQFTAGSCCPSEAKCRKCTANLKSECPDPCVNACSDGEVCRAVEFEEYCCPKAVCSQEVLEAITIDTTSTAPSSNSCEGVVCKDPCNCAIQSDPYCGYDCTYDPFPSTECCPSSTFGCEAWCF